MSRVMVVEDDPHILRVLSLWLSRQGHELLEARNGQLAWELMQNTSCDVMITDVNMPGIDGVQLIEKLIENGREPRGIVVLTNRWDHGDIRDRLAEWGVHVLPKPFSPARIAALVKDLAEGRSAVNLDESEPVDN